MVEAARLVEKSRCLNGEVYRYSHMSATCNDRMRFMAFVPDAARERPLPVLYFLAGLTCTEETFMTKAGAIAEAAAAGLILVAPDTSPRNARIEGENAAWDFGLGAGFYVDATEAPWNAHYRMYSYVTEELPQVVAATLPADISRSGIFGHSMGGHGALICALKNPGQYRSVSAFAPICAPTEVPWGKKAFTGYLGTTGWEEWDATALIRAGVKCPHILVDQGTADKFLDVQLKPEQLQAACLATGQLLTLNMREGFDHSYYFISSFIGLHVAHHAAALNLP